MSEEIFDVVDENDQVIDQRTRSEVHRLGLRHRAIHLLVFNAKDELFLQKRSMKKDCFPGKWDSSASGHLDCGEEYDACVFRETRENLEFNWANCRRNFSRSMPARRPVRNSSGLIESNTKAHSNSIRRKSRKEAGSRRQKSTNGSQRALLTSLPAFVLLWKKSYR